MQHSTVVGGSGGVGNSVTAAGTAVDVAVVPELRLCKVPIDCYRRRWSTHGRVGVAAFMRVSWDVGNRGAKGVFDPTKRQRKASSRRAPNYHGSLRSSWRTLLTYTVFERDASFWFTLEPSDVTDSAEYVRIPDTPAFLVMFPSSLRLHPIKVIILYFLHLKKHEISGQLCLRTALECSVSDGSAFIISSVVTAHLGIWYFVVQWRCPADFTWITRAFGAVNPEEMPRTEQDTTVPPENAAFLFMSKSRGWHRALPVRLLTVQGLSISGNQDAIDVDACTRQRVKHSSAT